jgi:hypothetical protein
MFTGGRFTGEFRHRVKSRRCCCWNYEPRCLMNINNMQIFGMRFSQRYDATGKAKVASSSRNDFSEAPWHFIIPYYSHTGLIVDGTSLTPTTLPTNEKDEACERGVVGSGSLSFSLRSMSECPKDRRSSRDYPGRGLAARAFASGCIFRL